MLRKSIIATVGLAMVLGAGASRAADSDDQRGQLSEKDYKFAKDAAACGNLEVQLGELAKQKGVNQSVKDFGQRMVTDHTKANTELKEILARKGAALPATMSHHERSTLDKLLKASGADFDKDYASAMVKDHKSDLKDFKDAATDVKDPDLKAFATKTQPILEEHLQMAERMEAAVKGEK